MLKRAFVSRDLWLWKDLYVSLVRPHLEYAVQVWNPRLEKDISRIENVQRRATRVPSRLRGLTYEDRLGCMGLTTLEQRRLRGDLIQMFKVATGLESVCWVVPPLFKKGFGCSVAGGFSKRAWLPLFTGVLLFPC